MSAEHALDDAGCERVGVALEIGSCLGRLRLDAPGGVSVYGYLLTLPYRYVNDAQLAPRNSVLLGLSKTF